MGKEGTLAEIMTKNLTTVLVNETFPKLKELFEKSNFHHLPVVDKNGEVKGIISRTDFLKAAFNVSVNTAGKQYSQKFYDSLQAKDIMTKNPVVLSSDSSIGLAADLFMENVYHALPVVDDGELKGIITTHDLLAYAFYKAPVGNGETSD